MANQGWKIAIVGGGVGGLTLGLALREQGIEADIYEQADELREVGAAADGEQVGGWEGGFGHREWPESKPLAATIPGIGCRCRARPALRGPRSEASSCRRPR